MSLSYSGIVGSGSGKASLPSVDSWGGNMNILRDPPKSITTRKIDKVSDTNSMVELIDQSGDRVCEAISVYARGVNPMVSVSYGNEGNNGGKNGNILRQNNGKQAYLPYRIIKDGAFRPPIKTPYELLPLSRQPRLLTSNSSNPSFIDFSKKAFISNTGDKYREIKDKIKVSVTPTKTFKIDNQIIEPFEFKYIIKNPVKFDPQAGISGKRTTDITTLQVLEPTKEIYQKPLNIKNIYSNQGTNTNIKYVDNSHLNTDHYIQNTLHSSVQSNISQSIQVTSIEDINDIDIRIKDPINISYTPIKTGYTKQNYIHDDLELNRKVIYTDAETNKNLNIYKRHEIEHQKEYKKNIPFHNIQSNHGTTHNQINSDIIGKFELKPTINYGSYEGKATIPTTNRNEGTDKGINEKIQSEKTRRDLFILEMKQARSF